MSIRNFSTTPRLDWLALWILFSAWSSLSGWALSIFHCLNLAGIVLSYALFLSILALGRDQLQIPDVAGDWKIVRSPFLAPKLWLALTVLVLIGGMAYAPTNYDYLTYRFPRVLYWSWDQGWSWISTVNNRINYSGVGFEWLMTPLFIVFKSDRLFFLINFISYLLLPGLIFSVFAGLGISRRIAWWWMWVLPCGYCYILQAGSAGNDSFAAVYFLAGLHYLFRTKTGFPMRNLALSCLAIALMTEAKASNLPLVLPWLTVLFFHRQYILERNRMAVLVLIFVLAAAISFLPTAVLNIYFTGDYTGDPTNMTKMKVQNPIMGVLGNSLQLAKDNLALPVTSRSTDWSPMLPPALKAALARDFPKLDMRSEELQIEEGAGMGLGIVLFLGLFLAEFALTRMGGPVMLATPGRMALWTAGAVGIAWAAYMSKIGSEATSRLLATYYPGLIASIFILISLDGRIVHHRALKGIGYLAMLSALPLVILSPARPLFPVQEIAGLMMQNHVPPSIVERYNEVYSVYAARSDAFKPIMESIPSNERALGFVQFSDDTEVSLWRPFGSRKVIEVTPEDSAEEIKAKGIHFILAGQDAVQGRYHTTLATLATKWSASVVVEKDILLKAHQGPETWYLLRL